MRTGRSDLAVQNSTSFAFDGRYAGVFLAHADPSGLKGLATPLGVTLSGYRSPGVSISIALGGQHPEPVVQWLHAAHELCDGASFLAELVDTGASVPDHPHCHLLRLPEDEFDEELRDRLVEASALTLRLPFSREVLVLCDAESGRLLCEGRSRLRNSADFGLSLFAADSQPPPREHPQPREYDPIGSQATETLRGTASAFEGNLAEVRRALREVFGFEAPSELVAVETEVSTLLRTAESRLEAARAGVVDGDVAATALDIAATVGVELTERLGRLAGQLESHLSVPDPWKRPVPYGRVAESHGLCAIRAVVAECADRLAPNLPDSLIVPVLGEHLGFGTGLLGELPFVVSSRAPSGTLISYPRRLLLRAGALPIIASPVVAGTCDLRSMADRLVTGDLAKAGRQLGVRLKVPDDGAHTAAAGRATVFLGDLVSTLIFGPAYVYALARFTPGAVASGPARLPSSRSPSLSERISLCIRLLRRHRVQVHFQSDYVREDRRPIPRELADLAGSLVRRPYGFRSEQLRRVTAALQRGQVVSEPPGLLLNALWDAVVRRGSYVNEVALYESLVRAA